MSFSDEDLKRLKDEVLSGNYDWTEILTPESMKALLARMEAAENFRQLVLAKWRARMPQELVDADEDWKKAAGRK